MNLKKPYSDLFFLLLFCIFVSGCVSTQSKNRIDDIPMYGQPDIPRSEFHQNLDKEFIEKASKPFKNRDEACKAWVFEAEGYFQQGNFHYAMRRYNQAWLLNPNSYLPYWGFGRVMLQRDKFDESIKYFNKAISLIDDDYQKPSLYSDAGSAFSYKALSIQENRKDERQKYFDLANEHFEKATTIDPNYSSPWRRWAFSLFEEKKYFEAWEKVHKARSLGAKPYPKKFIEDLSSKMKEPQ